MTAAMTSSSVLGPAPPVEADELQQEESSYFSELLSYSLERLSKEPELLRADQEQLHRQLQDTAVGHYRSFIDTTRCLADLQQQLAAATGHLDDLARDLPKLQAACDRFRHSAAAIATKRNDNRQLYSECGGRGHARSPFPGQQAGQAALCGYSWKAWRGRTAASHATLPPTARPVFHRHPPGGAGGAGGAAADGHMLPQWKL